MIGGSGSLIHGLLGPWITHPTDYMYFALELPSCHWNTKATTHMTSNSTGNSETRGQPFYILVVEPLAAEGRAAIG